MSNTISIGSLVTILAVFLLASCGSDPHVTAVDLTTDSVMCLVTINECEKLADYVVNVVEARMGLR